MRMSNASPAGAGLRRLAWILTLLFVVCGPDGPTGLDPSDAPRLASVEPPETAVRVAAGVPVEFRVDATSPRGMPLAITFLVDGIPRASEGTFVFSPEAEGTYRITAVVSDGELETAREWTVTVDPPPNATPSVVLSIDPGQGRAPLAARLRLAGDDPDGRIVRHRLELAGPSPVAIEGAAAVDTVLTLSEGSWEATGTVEDDRGAVATATRRIEVGPPNRPPRPRLVADPVAGPAPLDVHVQAGGDDPDGEVVLFRLDATGDGAWEIESADPFPQIVRYESAGTYRLVLAVRDDAGAEARDSVEIRVEEPPPPPPGNAAPVPAFALDPRDGAAPLDVLARLTATDADGLVARLEIDFDGDGASDATGSGPALEAAYRYEEPGEYVARALAVDDDGATGAASVRVVVRAHRNEPPSGALTADVARGDAPLEVRLLATGSDSDGRIVRWEIDADDGRGFAELTGPLAVNVVYAFREDPYRPRLRLTDDGGAIVEVEGAPILVHRPVAGGAASVSGNPRFDATAIAPAVWSDGRDAWRWSLVVRDADGEPLPGVPVRAVPGRPALAAPDGTALGPAVRPGSPAPATGGDGRSGGTLVTSLSTRIERAPVIAFQPFGVVFEADAGHGEWRAVARVDGLNANTAVSASASRVLVFPANQAVCPGTSIEIEVQARAVPDAPVAGPVPDRYVELRYTDGTLLDARPRAGWSAWRTDGAGVIRFAYAPTRADQSRLVKAWADGQPIDELGLIALRPPTECGS